MNSEFIEDKIKIIKLTIKILEKSHDEEKLKKLQKEKELLEEYKNKFPEFFI